MRVVLLALLAGCYAPQITGGLPCSESNDCPAGEICDLATLTCVTEVPEAHRFAKLSAGYEHACGIEFDADEDGGGTAWCWGRNEAQELGTTGPLSTTPNQVGGDDDWIAVSVADNESLGIRADGSLWVWGEYGPLRALDTDTEWASVSAGYLNDCALDVDGAMTCGLLTTPAAEQPGRTWARLAVNDERICAIDPDDHLWCWGKNNDGAVGTGDEMDPPGPIEPMPGETFKDVAAAYTHTCAIRSDGVAFCWGSCGYGQLGDGVDAMRACNNVNSTPTRVLGDSYDRISAHDRHTCAVNASNDIYCWGLGEYGQTGSGVELHADPRLALGNGDWIDVAAGGSFTCARDGDGETFCWGANYAGQLGDGNGEGVDEPMQVEPGRPWASASAGYRATCAIETDGSLWCWGRNGRGELGTGDRRQQPRPVQIGELVGWSTVSVGRDHACGILGGVMHCWGAQESRADGAELLVPTGVAPQDDWSAVAAATWYTCGVRNSELWCWSVDQTPQRLGTDTGWTALAGSNGPDVLDRYVYAVRDGRAYAITGQFDLLAETPEVTDWETVTAGYFHACGLRSDGTAWCWGANGSNALGNPTVDGATVIAVPVETTERWISIAAGLTFTCAVDDDFELWCWGALVDSATPVQIDTPGDFRSVSAGRDHVCAVRSDDSLWCWGGDDNDQLGRGLGGSSTPVRVLP